MESNAAKAQELFDRVAEDNPAEVLDLLARLSEFVIPKLPRSTIDGKRRARFAVVRNTYGELADTTIKTFLH